ncbi:hypothetical protein OF846_004697 [Rhodotorula toruloides]|nr:hypothetical protein OF846_004697 [Rhodotorula toruloides]
MSRWKSKGRASDADEDAEMSGEEEARQNGTNGRVRMAATAFMPLANFRIEPSETFPRPDTPMRQLQPPPMPLASSSSGSATRQPPSKRARRVLATEEEMKEWESEKGRTKNGVADRETEMEEGAETSVEGTKQKARPTGKTARLPPDPHPPPARPIAATPKTFRPLTAFGLSPSLTTSTSKPTASSSSRTAARPAPVSALGRVPLPLPPPGRPKTPTTPREAESKPAKPLANLSSLLPARSPSTPKDKGEERKPILALAPPASILASRATGDDAEVEEGEDEWSPRKKGRGKGYIHSGIAARTATLLSSSRTTHTLWLHSLSRLLSNHPSTREELLERMRPDVRLRVGEMLDPFSSVAGAALGGGGAGGGRKTLLTRCRLILPSESTTSLADEGPRRRDLEGLVFFSLHFSTSSSSSTTTISTSSAKQEAGQKATLVVPQNPHDLARFVSVGREVWVWEPWGEVGVAQDLSEFGIGRAGRGAEKRDEEGEGGVRVEWAPPGGRRGEERQGEKEMARKGLVCSRFAVVVP